MDNLDLRSSFAVIGSFSGLVLSVKALLYKYIYILEQKYLVQWSQTQEERGTVFLRYKGLMYK